MSESAPSDHVIDAPANDAWNERLIGGHGHLAPLPMREEESLDPQAPPTWKQPLHPDVESEICKLIDDLIGHARTELLAAGYEMSTKEEFGMRLGLDEAVVNGARHGNEGDPAKIVTIRWRLDQIRSRFCVEIKDEGKGFKVDDVPDCTSAARTDIPHGRGLILMRRYLEEVNYPEENGGSLVHMEKTFGKQAAA